MDDNKNAKAVSPELSDEALDAVAGGFGGPKSPCPDCGSTRRARLQGDDYICPDCEHIYFHRPRPIGFF